MLSNTSQQYVVNAEKFLRSLFDVNRDLLQSVVFEQCYAAPEYSKESIEAEDGHIVDNVLCSLVMHPSSEKPILKIGIIDYVMANGTNERLYVTMTPYGNNVYPHSMTMGELCAFVYAELLMVLATEIGSRLYFDKQEDEE